MSKEILLNHDDIRHPVGICDVIEKEFQARDMDLHRHEALDVTDDFKKGVRRITVKNTKYFGIGDVPWHKGDK